MGHGVTMSLLIGSIRAGRLRRSFLSRRSITALSRPSLSGMGIQQLQHNWAEQCYPMVGYKAHELGWTKLGANKQHYSTVQAVLNECTCKYDYEGAAKTLLTTYGRERITEFAKCC